MYKSLSLPLLLLVFLLGGCATKSTAPQLSLEKRLQLWEIQRQNKMKLPTWRLQGRLGVRVPGESGTLSIDWQQDALDYVIYLDGPLGQSLAKVDGKSDIVSLEASGEVYTGSSPEQLLYNVIGWDLPVSHLRYWVLGLPDPVLPYDVLLDDAGNPQTLEQNGWTIEYQQFRQQNNLPMPRRVKARRGSIQLTLAARTWFFPSKR